MPITAGGTGVIEIDRFGNHVAELGFWSEQSRRRTPLRRVASVLACGMAGGPHRRPVRSGLGPQAGAPSQQMGNAD